MADNTINVKLLQGPESAMIGSTPPAKVDGQLYFATIDKEGKGYIYLDSNGKRFSFGKHAIYDSNGDKIVDTYATKNQGIYYIEGTGSTAGQWGGSHTDITSYYSGLTIIYKVPVAGASATTLAINSLDPIPVVKNATTAVSTSYPVNSIVMLVYTIDPDGKKYWKVADYDTNTNTQMRVYRQTSGYDANTYPLLVSRTAASSIGTAGTNGGYADVYGIFRENSDHLPTLRANPAQGIIFANIFRGLADQATSDGGGNEIFSTYINGLKISNLDFDGNVSNVNLYLTATAPSGKIIPTTANSDYIIPAADTSTPGLLSLTAQTICGNKTIKDSLYFANGTNYYIDNTALGKLKGLSVDNNSNISNGVIAAPDSLIQASNFNIALNGSSNGILFKSSNVSNNGFIQYNYSNSIGELILGINSGDEDDKVIIQSSGENSLLHYNDLTQTYSAIFDTENFKTLQISIFGSITDYNQNITDFNFNGSQPISIHAGNAYQDMTNTVADSSTPTSGINASTLGGYSYLDIAAEMLLSDAEVAELVG